MIEQENARTATKVGFHILMTELVARLKTDMRRVYLCDSGGLVLGQAETRGKAVVELVVARSGDARSLRFVGEGDASILVYYFRVVTPMKAGTVLSLKV